MIIFLNIILNDYEKCICFLKIVFLFLLRFNYKNAYLHYFYLKKMSIPFCKFLFKYALFSKMSLKNIYKYIFLKTAEIINVEVKLYIYIL